MRANITKVWFTDAYIQVGAFLDFGKAGFGVEFWFVGFFVAAVFKANEIH